MTFKDANVDITGSNNKSAISGENSTVIFDNGSKAKVRMLEDDSGVTAEVRGSARVFLSEQLQLGTAVSVQDLTSGWLLYGDKADLKGLPDGCSLPESVDMDQPTTYQPFSIRTSFDVSESSIVVTVAENGQRTVNWNGQKYSIWNTNIPITITGNGSQTPNRIGVSNASNTAIDILLDNVNIHSPETVALNTLGPVEVILQGSNVLHGRNYGIYGQMSSAAYGDVNIVKNTDDNTAKLTVSGDWDGIHIDGSLSAEGVTMEVAGKNNGIESGGSVTLKNAKATVTGAKTGITGNIVSIAENSVVNATGEKGIVGDLGVSISENAKVKASNISSNAVTVGGKSKTYLTNQPNAEKEISTDFAAQDGTGWLVYKKDDTLHSIPAGLDTSSLNDAVDPADYTELPQKQQSGHPIEVTYGVADYSKASKDTLVTVTAVSPKDGKNYEFNGWTVNSPEGLTPETGTLSDSTFTFKMPDLDVKLTANWKEKAKPESDPTPEVESYLLTVTGADIALEDGTPLDSGEEVKAGTKVIVTAHADTSTAVFETWIADGLELTDAQLTTRELQFTMPDNAVSLTASTRDPGTGGGGDPGTDILLAIGGGVVVGGIAYYLYYLGTTAYLDQALPEGTAIPTNREQLAVVLWQAAGKPTAQSSTTFTDVDTDPDTLSAIRWAVETGLLDASPNEDGTVRFDPTGYTLRFTVIQTWLNLQEYLKNT